MKCRGNFKFKGLVKKDGGEFINKDGKNIKYKEKYLLKVDETTENGIYERKFNIPIDSSLLQDLNSLKPYNDLTIEFDLKIYSNSIQLVPIAIIK